MSLYDAMNAGVTGMGAQSNYLSNIGQNIANSATIGYKQADTEFSTLVDQAGVGQTSAGGVSTTTRLDIAAQGTTESTSSPTDLAISGNGFFVVSNTAGQEFLTRAGSFVPDKSGNLVNGAGYYLMGYSLANGTPNIASNSLTGMQVVNVSSAGLSATPTTSATFAANLPSTDTVIPAPALPALPTPSSSSYSEKTSMVMYGDLGQSATVSLYLQNNGPVTVAGVTTDNWTVAAYDSSGNQLGSTQTLTFSPTTGSLTSGGTMTIPLATLGGGNVTLSMSGMTQLAGAYTVATSTANGNAASSISSATIGKDGTLSYGLASGSTVAAYKIPLASVASPDNLLASTGNVYSPNLLSGQATVGTAGTGQLGTINASQLEESTVDIATELTNMIVAQRSYSANSQMFKCGADLMNTLIQMNLT
jgi:flagellar hook protein FlgE